MSTILPPLNQKRKVSAVKAARPHVTASTPSICVPWLWMYNNVLFHNALSLDRKSCFARNSYLNVQLPAKCLRQSIQCRYGWIRNSTFDL